MKTTMVSVTECYCTPKYEVCSKSNETGVIKTVLKKIEIYQSQILSK